MFILNLLMLITLTYVYSMQISVEGPKTTDTYGPYVVSFKYFDSCPNAENNLANLSIALVSVRDTIFKGTINVTIDKPVRIVKMKVVIQSVKNNKKFQLGEYTVEKPCLNRLVSGVLKNHVDIRTCVFRKGTHTVKVNFSEVVYLFFGNSFFYGEYIPKITLFSTSNQVILCIIADQYIRKKTKA